MLNELGALDYVVTRMNSDGGFSDSLVSGGGIYVPGTTEQITIRALVQPLDARELAMLSEGDRQRQGWSVWTESLLNPGEESGNRSPDQITIDGEIHVIVKTEKWGGPIPHYKSIALLKEEQP